MVRIKGKKNMELTKKELCIISELLEIEISEIKAGLAEETCEMDIIDLNQYLETVESTYKKINERIGELDVQE